MVLSIVNGISNKEYQSINSISSSDIKLINSKSLFHYKEMKRSKEIVEQSTSKSMLIGSAWHCMIFEPDELSKRYFIPDDDNFCLRSKASKDAVSIAKNEGKDLLKKQEYEEILAMSDVLLGNATAKNLLNHREKYIESCIFWKDKKTGIECKIRPDYMIPPKTSKSYPNGLIIDGKTTQDASLAKFSKDVIKYGYHIQAAHYCNGYKKLYKDSKDIPTFIFLVQETVFPYAFSFYTMPKSLIDYGRDICIETLEKIYTSTILDEWPSYNECKITPINIPYFISGDDLQINFDNIKS